MTWNRLFDDDRDRLFDDRGDSLFGDHRFRGRRPMCSYREWRENQPLIPPCWFAGTVLPQRVIAPASEYDRLRGRGGSATLSAATVVASHAWPFGSASSAEKYVATLAGHAIDIFIPVGGSTTLPSAQQVCNALQAVPARQRNYTRTVHLCPTAHPNSSARRTVGGEGGGGIVILFPYPATLTQNVVDNLIMHEIGHNFHESLWHSPADVAAWVAARDRDARFPSTYAQTNAALEDFCEFLIIFNTTRGILCEASARTIFRHRWDLMLAY